MFKTFGASLAVTVLAAIAGLAQDAERGGQDFSVFCAACHGDLATGDGPMSAILKKTPPDLTGLAARNQGVFPRAAVVFRIDGRDPLPAHGGEMPIFGGLFDGTLAALKSESGQPILTSPEIADLVFWLESVQR